MKFKLIWIAILALGLKGMAQNPDFILGVWFNEEKDSKIEVYEENGKYYGKVIWIKNDQNDDGTKPKLDKKNPDTELQKRRIVGTLILKDLVWDADDDEWDDGEIYDPKSGKTYSCYGEVESKNELFLKGYIGFSLIGKSTIWSRP